MLLPVLPGDVLDGKYAVEDVIGEGGMGFVLAARHVELDVPVAVKVLRPHASQETRQRFLREARAASQIESEHVAKVFDVGRLEDGTPYMIMELLDGRDLDDVVWEDGPLAPETAVAYALQACEALAAAHRRGVVHRDVKPANLFLTHREDGSPCIKLLDFGISKVPPRIGEEPGSLTMTGSFVGSPQFMSPEQMASCRKVDARSDLWSLGVCLFELLTGEAAFEGQTVAELYSAILRDEPRRIRDFRPDVPAALEWVVLSCLEKDASRRVQSAEELAEMLQPFSPDGDQPAPVTIPPSRPCARPSGWSATEVMERLPSFVPEDDPEICVTAADDFELPADAEGASHEHAPESLEEPDRTPAGTVRPVSVEPEPTTRSRWSLGGWVVAAGLVAGGLIAGGLLGASVSGTLSWEPQQKVDLAQVSPINAAPVLVVTSPPPAAESSASPSPFVYSTQLSDEQRTHLMQELETAAGELERGELRTAVARVDGVVQELSTLGVEPNKANSSIGAKAQLLLGRAEVARARTLLEEQPSEVRRAQAWSKRVDVGVGQARVAYEKVKTWGVKSFYRCGLVEMAELDRNVGQAFAGAAEWSSVKDRKWYLAQAQRHLKRARVGLRHALQVQSETMLCVTDAQQELGEVTSALSELRE